MTTRFAAKKSADGNVTEEESELAARLEGLRIAGGELEERLKRDLIASLKDSEARQDVSAAKLAAQIAAANAEQEKRLLEKIARKHTLFFLHAFLLGPTLGCSIWV